MTLLINASVTLDESAGLQTSGVATATEDNNDNDILVGLLPASMTTRLTALGANTSTAVGSATGNVGTLGGGSTLTGFVGDSGAALPVYNGANTLQTVQASFTTLAGETIYLCIDNGSLGDNLLLGVTASGEIVFAVYTVANGNTVSIATIQFEALDNPLNPNPDDPVDLTGLVDLAISSPVEFNFNTLPSGQNLFGTVGNAQTAIVVIGRDIDLNADNTFTNDSNTINTSQGGGSVTIGVNNQMFDPGEGAYFTYVTNPDPNYLSGVTGGLDQNEADDLDNVQFGNTISNVNSAFLRISQTQGNTNATIKLTTFDVANLDGNAFEAARGTGGAIDITQVKVTIGTTTYTFNTNSTQGGVTVSNLDGFQTSVTIAGLPTGAKVEWTTTVPHNQVLVEGVAGKFDIGGFGLVQGQVEHLNVGDRIRFEDDGPAITVGARPDELVVDETFLGAAGATASASIASLFTRDAGLDGGTMNVTLEVKSGGTGLFDTATGDEVILVRVSGSLVEGRNGDGDVVFSVALTGGNLVLTQHRAVVHDDPDDSDESASPAVLSAADLITLVASLTDGDSDNVSETVNIADLLNFEDDGPHIDLTGVMQPTLTLDDTDLSSTTDGAFANQFASGFGQDGEGTLSYDLTFDVSNANTGLTDTETGLDIVLVQNGNTIAGQAAGVGTPVFEISVDQDGQITFTQNRSVAHNDPNDDVESGISAAFLNIFCGITLTATITDKDGDHDEASVDITAQFAFEDDGPTLGLLGDLNPIEDSEIAGAAPNSVSKTFFADVGEDTASATNGGGVFILNFDDTIDYGEFQLTGTLSADGKTVSYKEAGGDTVYTMTIAPENDAATPENWQYSFTVNKTLLSPPLDFDFSDLPSGQNLYGMVGDSTASLVVIGQFPTINQANGLMTQASNTINTSKGGGAVTIGVNNQMFNPGEGAYFTYATGTPSGLVGANLDANEADDADNIQFSDTLSVTTASLDVVQTQGSRTALKTLEIHAYTDAESSGTDFVNELNSGNTETNITAIHVYDANGQEVTTGISVNLTGLGAVVSGFQAGYRIEWDTAEEHNQVLVTDIAGAWDIGGFHISEPTDLPDQLLNFEVGVIDGDGDHQSDTFTVAIDGNLDGDYSDILII